MKTGPTLCVIAIALATSCKAGDLSSPLLDLANRLYLDGDWTWADSMRYSDYVPEGDSAPHRGAYIFTGTASLEPGDSSATESYILTALATLTHVDSTGDSTQVEAWMISDIAFEDTVEIRNDTIFNLAVEPIPPAANPNTNLIRWVLGSKKLWCTNWLTDTMTAGNTESCETVITWTRSSPRVP